MANINYPYFCIDRNNYHQRGIYTSGIKAAKEIIRFFAIRYKDELDMFSKSPGAEITEYQSFRGAYIDESSSLTSGLDDLGVKKSLLSNPHPPLATLMQTTYSHRRVENNSVARRIYQGINLLNI